MKIKLENGQLYCWQWETNQRLVIDTLEGYEAENLICKMGILKDKIGIVEVQVYEENGKIFSNIPDVLLQYEGLVEAWVQTNSEFSSATLAYWRFRVKKRERPEDYIYTEIDVLTWQELDKRITVLEENFSTLPEDDYAAIIDVIELPTENINEDCFYRLLTGSLVASGEIIDGCTCYCVENLPEVGDPVTTDMENVTAYYSVADGDVYGYVNDVLGSQAGVPAGWYTLGMLAPLFGVEWGGVTTNILDSVENDTAIFVLLEHAIWQYSGEWVIMKNVGRVGTGFGAEIFNYAINDAIGNYSHAEGCDTSAFGAYSHAEGGITVAHGFSSHAEGYDTSAFGTKSHAEGDGSLAYGDCSHAEGCNTMAGGGYSHAEGYGTIAQGRGQHVQGNWNIEDAAVTPYHMGKYAHIVGNGDDDNNRSNAHTLDWDGNAWYQGDVYVGSTSGINKDEGSKKLATEEYVDATIKNLSDSLSAVAASGDYNDLVNKPEVPDTYTRQEIDAIMGSYIIDIDTLVGGDS